MTLALSAAGAHAEDADGCKDSPIIKRFPGSEIPSCENKEYEQADMPLKDDEVKKVEGEYHYWDYGTRDGVSGIQIFRNFENALKSAGFIIDFEQSPGTITAHKGATWITIDNRESFYYQTIVTEKAMVQELSADASALGDEIARSGHVAVYGIHFATGQATIEPDSEQTLNEIVKLLAGSPALKLRVEGYTDNIGQAAANQALSDRRARAVMAWLTGHGVDASRLAAKGLGQADPVGENATEDGRARNRRVELVKM